MSLPPEPPEFPPPVPRDAAAGDLCFYSVSDALHTISGPYVVNGRAEQGDVLMVEAPVGKVFLNEGCGDWERIGD